MRLAINTYKVLKHLRKWKGFGINYSVQERDLDVVTDSLMKTLAMARSPKRH